MKTNRLILSLITMMLTLSQSLMASPWKHYLNDEQREFATIQMERILELYHAGDEEAALDEVERSYTLAEQKYAQVPHHRVHFFHRIIWWEAQTHTGRDDPEWGAKLYEYLYQRDVIKNGERKIIPPAEYILIGNIMGCLEEIGMAAEARSWILHLEDNICTYRGLNTISTGVYTDDGSIFPFIPEARKREFPLHRQEVPEISCNCTSPHALYYPYLYAIHYIADDALKSGDWARAAELYYWYLTYTDMYVANPKNKMRNEIFRGNLQCVESLAEICRIHMEPQEIVPMYDLAISQIEQNGIAQNGALQMAMFYREYAKIELGILKEDAIQIADDAIETLPEIIFYSQSQIVQFKLLRARIYHALGRQVEAWAQIDNLHEATKQDINPYLWTYLLTTMIDLAIADGAIHPELESWIITALENERLKGNKFGELPLYEKYAFLLMKQGRYEEALQIQREALRLSKAMDIRKRILTNEETLQEFINLNVAQSETIEDTNLAKTVDPKPEIQPKDTVAQNDSSKPNPNPNTAGGISTSSRSSRLDIQPYASTTVAVEGQPSYGRLYVFNPSSDDEEGKLRISGRINEITWLDDTWISIGSSDQLPATSKDESLIVPAGAFCVIDFVGLTTKSTTENSVTCEWISSEPTDNTVSGTWTYSTSSDNTRTSVIDAHAIRENPFYLIPIHHMIQRPDTPMSETVDFSISSSIPIRIETYNAQTDELIAVDANGDGDFKDTGDFIGVDANRNNWPDIGFDPEQTLTSVVLYIRPYDNIQATSTELTVKVLDQGQWRIDAIDYIEFEE